MRDGKFKSVFFDGLTKDSNAINGSKGAGNEHMGSGTDPARRLRGHTLAIVLFARPAITLPIGTAEHHHPLTATKLHCLKLMSVTGSCVGRTCPQLLPGMQRTGWELNSRPLDRKSDVADQGLSHQVTLNGNGCITNY